MLDFHAQTDGQPDGQLDGVIPIYPQTVFAGVILMIYSLFLKLLNSIQYVYVYDVITL